MIEDICTNEKYSFTGGPFGSNLKVGDYTQSGVRVIQLNNINDIYFNDDNKVFVSVEKADSLKSCNAYSGDLIFAKMMPAGRLCILPKTYDRYLLGSDAIRLKPNIDKYYCFFLLECLNRTIIRNSITSKTSGSTRQRIGLLDLKKTSFYCPNYIEQKQIGLFFELIESKISNISKKINILKKYKEGLLFQYKKEANKNGKILKLASICSLISGYNFNTNDYVTNGKFDIVTIGNVMDDRYIEGDYKHVNFIPNSHIKLSKGDLLISMTGNVGRCSYVNDNNKLLNQRLCKFECEDTNKKFIYMMTKTNSFKKRMNILAQGGAQPNLKNNDILNYVFSKIENNMTHQKYVEAFDKIELLLEQSKCLIKNMKHLKKNLLNQLFI